MHQLLGAKGMSWEDHVRLKVFWGHKEYEPELLRLEGVT